MLGGITKFELLKGDPKYPVDAGFEYPTPARIARLLTSEAEDTDQVHPSVLAKASTSDLVKMLLFRRWVDSQGRVSPAKTAKEVMRKELERYGGVFKLREFQV